MRKILLAGIITFSFLVLFYACESAQSEVERIFEDGVEVIVNHLEPYILKGEPRTLQLEKEFLIDMQKGEIAEIGLTDIWGLDVDSKGNFYLLNEQDRASFVFKFNQQGNFVLSFGRKGQGPSEIQYPLSLQVIKDEIVISDRSKVLFFDEYGGLIKEIPKDSSKRTVIPLENGNYLIHERIIDPYDRLTQHTGFILYDSEFKKIKEIDRGTLPNPYKGKGWPAILPFVYACVSQRMIMEGNSERGYEIFIYDLDGNLIKKIMRDHKPVPVGKEDKKRLLKQYDVWPEQIKKRIYVPDSFPPLQRLFFPDEEGRLFVMTYEKGEKPREFKHDIFNPEGAFIAKTYLDNYGQIGESWGPLPAAAKNNRLYYVREKESGYKELVVCKVRWK